MFFSLSNSFLKSLTSVLLCAVLLYGLTDGLFFAREAEAEVILSDPEQRSWIGLTTRELDEYTARMLSIDPGEFRGLVVIDVTRDGPADEAGIIRGDVLLSVDDKEIAGYEEFKTFLNGLDAGSTLKLLVDKGGTIKDVLITLGSMQGVIDSAGSGFAGVKDLLYTSEELHDYYWMKEAQQYDYTYSLALDVLNLTQAQRRQARLLMSGYEKKMLRYSADINIAEVELREQLAKEPIDLLGVHDKIVNIAAKRTELRFKRIRTHAAFKRLLTKAQLRKLKEFMSARQGRGRFISD